MEKQVVASLDNIANASVQRNDTVEKFVISNKNITNNLESLQADNEKIIELIQALLTFPPATQSNKLCKITKEKPKNDNMPTLTPWNTQGY